MGRDESDFAALSETARRVVEEVGSRGNLKSLGVSFGYSENYAHRAARRILGAATAEVMVPDTAACERQPAISC